MLSAGQLRLRELVAATARTINPDALWWPEGRMTSAGPEEQRAGALLKQLRDSALRDPVITTDAITGQRLHRPPVSSTYARAQRFAGASQTVSSSAIDAEAIVGYHTDRPGGDLACSGANKPNTVYGALTWLALGRPLPFPFDANATLLPSSRTVICGTGGHHRTLACFLWGAGELTGTITIVDELADDELHAACRLIDSRLPNPPRGLQVRAHPQGHGACRAQLLELAQRLEPLPPLSEHDLPPATPSPDDIGRALQRMRSQRRRWLRRQPRTRPPASN